MRSSSLLWDVPESFAFLLPALAGCANSLVCFTLDKSLKEAQS